MAWRRYTVRWDSLISTRKGCSSTGFDEVSTIACLYNHPYYPEFLTRMGFRKDAEWVEYKILIPKEIPDKHQRIAEVVRRKYGLHVLRFKKISDIVRQGYGHKLFRLLNITYADLYGFSELTEEMIAYYIKKYVPVAPARARHADCRRKRRTRGPSGSPCPRSPGQCRRPAAECFRWVPAICCGR